MVLSAWPSVSASADDESDRGALAEQFFRAARAAYERGAYGAAALAFEQAYQAVPRGAAAFNAARSWELSGDGSRAAEDYAKAISIGDLEAGSEGEARSRLEALAPSLSRVDVNGPRTATMSVDGVDRGHLPQRLYLAPGLHRLRVRRLDGSVVERSSALAPTEALVVTIEDVRPPPAEPSTIARPTRPAPENGGMPGWGWATLGAMGLLTTAGAITYVQFEDTLNSFIQGHRRSETLRETTVRYQYATYVLGGLAAAAGITSAAAWLVPRRSKTSVQVGWGWVDLEGHF